MEKAKFRSQVISLSVAMGNSIDQQIEKKVSDFVKDQNKKSLKFDPMDKLQRSIV